MSPTGEGTSILCEHPSRRNPCHLLTIFESLIIHATCPSNCARVIVFKCSQENAVLPGAFKNNGLRHFLGRGRGGGGKQCIMGYSKIENRENEIPSFLSYLKVIGIAQSRELPLCGQVLYRLSTHGFLQLQTWTSQRKSVDSTEESTLRLVKLHSLKVIC